MARALECPACGARHRLDSLPDSGTFRCGQCGQVLRVPTVVPSDPGAPSPPPRTGAPASQAPPPRRRTPDAPATRSTVAGVSATVAATGSASPRAAQPDPRGAAPTAPPPAKRSRVAWYWRVLAWVVAVPLAFFLTAWPAYELGFIEKDDLLDIFVGTGLGRYFRLVLVTLAWALVTALLVQVLVEGGRVRAARRRRARAAAT